jgi:NAD+ synthase (glutamine-hydrolysing)
VSLDDGDTVKGNISHGGTGMRRLRIGMAQMNATVGDFAGNRHKILEAVARARSLGAELLTFPELAICGYPPEDLLFKPQFIEENLNSLDKVVDSSSGLTLVIGFADAREDIYNAAAIIHNGKLAGVYHKIYLPNYGVFDENRYFQSGSECPVYVINGIGVGINICEDIWYEAGPATAQAYAGAEVTVNISASPYYFGRGGFRERMLATRASDNVAVERAAQLVDRSEYKRRQAPPGIKITPRAFGRDRRLPITNRFKGG